MRIAAFNVENLFDRAKAFNAPMAQAQALLDAVAELNALFALERYTPPARTRILELLVELGLLRADEGAFVRLRRLRGALLRRPRSSPAEVVAEGRGSWVGWVEHKTEHVNEVAILNTGRVIRDVGADILAVIEAESRITLGRFANHVLREVAGEVEDPPPPYAHVMLIDGNDDRGIDVGLMTKPGFPIGPMRSHVDDFAGGERIFSRDCPEYAVATPGGATVWVLPNHFKSKFGGDTGTSRRKRRVQAGRVAELYAALRERGEAHVVVLGDLNDGPAATALAPLLGGTDLRDIGTHPRFDPGEFPGRGTFGLGNDGDKLDYVLLSPALFERVTAGGLFRKGAWPGTQPRRWSVYPQLREQVHAASDHHLIWADIDLD